MRMAGRILAAALLLAACSPGDADEPAVGATGTSVVTSTPVANVSTSAPQESTSTTAAQSTSTALPEIDFELTEDGSIGSEVFSVGLNEMVDIWIYSVIADELHVHGYDVYFDLEAGVPLNISFLADVPGIFEVERHTGNGHLFVIEVRG